MNKFLVSLIAVMTSMAANATCTITYYCGDGTGTPPASQSVASGTTFTPSANTCTRDGYMFSHYIAGDTFGGTFAQDGIAHPGTTYTIPFNDGMRTCSNSITFTLTAQWVPASTAVGSKSYTDSELDARQPAFTGSATSKLILFPDQNSADGAVGSRDIVDGLGTRNTTTGQYSASDLSSTEIPTRGAVLEGLNKKQTKVVGVANTVATYTNTAGVFSAKSVYSSAHNYPTALIDAQTLNSAVVDAVNSEFTRVDENGDPDPNGTLWRINNVNDLTTLTTSGIDLSPLMHTNVASYCYKRLSNGAVVAGTCTTTPSQYGDWGLVLTYNNEPIQVSGISACSTVNENLIAGGIPTNQSGVQADYESNMAAAPTNSPVGRYCYCKLTDPETSNARWVYIYSKTPSVCAYYCASYCADAVKSKAEIRHAVFGLSE